MSGRQVWPKALLIGAICATAAAPAFFIQLNEPTHTLNTWKLLAKIGSLCGTMLFFWQFLLGYRQAVARRVTPDYLWTIRLHKLLGVRRDGDVDVVQIEMLGAMDFETLPFPGAGMTPGLGGDMTMTMGPMHVSVSGLIDFDPQAGELLVSEATIIMDMVQHMQGTVETPEGAKEVNTEIITRDMKVDTTVEVVR